MYVLSDRVVCSSWIECYCCWCRSSTSRTTSTCVTCRRHVSTTLLSYRLPVQRSCGPSRVSRRQASLSLSWYCHTHWVSLTQLYVKLLYLWRTRKNNGSSVVCEIIVLHGTASNLFMQGPKFRGLEDNIFTTTCSQSREKERVPYCLLSLTFALDKL